MTSKHTDQKQRAPWLTRGVWCLAILLVLIGITAATGRGLFLADFGARMEPARQQILDLTRRRDPLASQRPAEVARADGSFATHRTATWLHIVPGGLFLLLVPVQFASGIRTRSIRLHRWCGRVLLVLGSTSAGAGLYFGLFRPYAGWTEATAIGLFGVLFLVALWRAFIAIRRHQVAIHREWMIRAFALGVAISTVRIIAALLEIALTPTGIGPPTRFVLAIWLGWGSTLAAAELWIIRTRPRRQRHSRLPDDLASRALADL